jgi:hypothetical protein
MELKDVKDLVNLFNEVNYKTLFKALMVYEQIDYIGELEDLTQEEIDYLEQVYNFYMKTDINLINSTELLDAFKDSGEREE